MKLNLKYEDADSEDAIALSLTAFNSKKNWGYSEELMNLWQTDLEITEEYILKNKVIKVFDREKFLGFFALKIENKEVDLDHLWLNPENIRQNYGREIFKYIIKYLSSMGYQRMKLVAEPNAAGFYEKMNGKVTGNFQSKVSGRALDIFEFQFDAERD